MGRMEVIKDATIKSVLKNYNRQYLVGDLKRKQIIEYFRDRRIEIGVTSYKDYHDEPTHSHRVATEYMYVIKGRTMLIDVDTKEEYEFVGGDFYVIVPETKYVQKSEPGTEIIFIKVPSIDDKELISVDQAINTWAKDKLRTVRTDYYYDESAPQANTIKPAVEVAIIGEDQHVLLLKRVDSGNWSMPGGTLEVGETQVECALREVKEKCGYDIAIQDTIGTYADPNIKTAYSNGEVRQEFAVVYSGVVIEGCLNFDEKSKDAQWISMSKLDSFPIVESQRRRLMDVKDYIDRSVTPS